MELKPYLITLQGVLTSADKKHGPFNKIKYKGGNEMKISGVIQELQNFFQREHYFSDKKPNEVYQKELKDIAFFLIINSEFDKEFILDDCQHLINIVPKLSKCLLANIIVNVNMSFSLKSTISKFPIGIVNELLEEIMFCLRKADPSIVVPNTYIYIHEIMNLLRDPKYTSNSKFADDLDKLVDISIELLSNFAGLNVERHTNKVFYYMGHSLLHLFQLLQNWREDDAEHQFFSRLMDHLFRTTCTMIKAITLNVFCAWAEMDNEGESFQTTICTAAYNSVEKFLKYKPAKELVQMLENIARKPLPLQDQILQASEETIIKMVEKANGDQQIWFRTLLNTQALNRDDTIKCIQKFSNLCTVDDIERLLSISSTLKNPRVKDLTLTCASNLDMADLILVVLRHFVNVGITNMLENTAAAEQLMLLMNKITLTGTQDINFEKQVLLLLLQNPVEVLLRLFAECIKNSMYTYCLKQLFSQMKDILLVDSLGINILVQAVEKHKPNDNNVLLYSEFFAMLIEMHCITYDKIIENVILPYLSLALNAKDFVRMLPMLKIINGIFSAVHLETTAVNTISTVLNILPVSRCSFFNFDVTKQNVTRQIVVLLERYISECQTENVVLKIPTVGDQLLKYYATRITHHQKSCLFKYLFSNFGLLDYYEVLFELIKFVPLCTTEEWLSIFTSFDSIVGFNKTVEILHDLLLLLCETIKTQEGNEAVTAAFKNCLQNYRSSLMHLMECNVRSLQDEIFLTKSVCGLLYEIPKEIKQTDWMMFVSLLTDRSLKCLVNDLQFVCSLLLIKESNITHLLSRKMLTQI